MAIKRRVLEQTDIRERWLRAGCEDVPLVRALKQLGLQIRFVPSLIMIDRDEIRLGDCLRFLDRQLLWVRLYYPACWWTCNVWQVLVASCMVVAGATGLAGLFVGQPGLFVGAVVLAIGWKLLQAWLEPDAVAAEAAQLAAEASPTEG